MRGIAATAGGKRRRATVPITPNIGCSGSRVPRLPPDAIHYTPNKEETQAICRAMMIAAITAQTASPASIVITFSAAAACGLSPEAEPALVGAGCSE